MRSEREGVWKEEEPLGAQGAQCAGQRFGASGITAVYREHLEDR